MNEPASGGHRSRRSWVQRFISDDWPIFPYQPLLYFFLFVGTIHVLVQNKEPIAFEEHLVPGAGGGWGALMMGSILLSGVSAWLIFKRPGKGRYIGFWTRFASDFGVLCGLGAFDVATWATLTDEQLFRHFVFGSVETFVFILVVRDLVRLFVTERLAGRIHRDGGGDR